jgi:hypothetical protein
MRLLSSIRLSSIKHRLGTQGFARRIHARRAACAGPVLGLILIAGLLNGCMGERLS